MSNPHTCADTSSPDTGAPLYVDLDGTLIYSDLLLESFLELLKHNILLLFLVPLWWLGGKANLKYQIARRVTLRANLLPYNSELLDYLRAQKALGRKLVLISASNEKLVQAVANQLGIFEDAIGSDATVNLSGTSKLERIRSMDAEFCYAGDRPVDLQVWRGARGAITVDANASLLREVAAVTTIEQSFARPRKGLRPYLKALRLHQWLKNTLVFLPLVLAHEITNPELIWRALQAFVCFGLCASSVYVLNDLLDLPSDRQHHSKCRRPFASGDISILSGLFMGPLLLISAFMLATSLPLIFSIILGLYFLVTALYSFVLKRIMLVDVIVLAGLYTVRIICGAAAISVVPTFWLLAFSMFLFFSLAVVKRYTELDYLRKAGISQSEGRGYYAQDLHMLAIFGSTSAFLSVMVFALYINNDETREQYLTPELLWLICPLLLYIIARIWLLAARGKIEEDPVVFALKDRVSQVLTLLCGVLLWLATYPWRAMLVG